MAEKHTASGVFPQFPGEDFLAHAGTQYKEQAEARLASRSLLAVAQGDYPPSVKSIVDVDLDSLPELPVDHRDYTRRQETRIKIQTQNAANAEKRYDLLMTAWTEVYTLLKESTETTAPVLSRQLRMSCDLLANRNITGGYTLMDLRHGASYCINSIMPIARKLTRTFIAQQSASSGPRRSLMVLQRRTTARER